MGNNISTPSGLSSKTSPKKKRFFRDLIFFPLLRWANVLVILCTFLAYLSPHIQPAEYWIFSFFGLLFPWWLLANILFVFLWIILRKKYFLFSLISIILGWGHVKSIVGFSTKSQFEKSESAINVMSFNCHGLRDRNNGNKRFSFEELKVLTKLESLHFLCLQEFIFLPNSSPYISTIKEQTGLPHHYYNAKHGLILFSAFPIVKSDAHYFGNRANGFQFADIKVQDRILRIYNIHLQSNLVSATADKVANEGNIKEKETWKDIKNMMRNYKYATQKRAKQAEQIADHIKQSPYPVIVCGDFNDVPQSYTYQKLSAELQDGFDKKGSGFAFTFLEDIPALRIDYILASPDLLFNGYKNGAIYFSDHLPVVANIKLN